MKRSCNYSRFSRYFKKWRYNNNRKRRSDATAVAVAKIFNADTCEIYTDVDGVFSTDPNKIPVAKKIDKISYDEMLRVIILGAKVMQSSAVQTAMMYDIPLEVRSTFTDRKGTKIFRSRKY